MCIMRPQRCPAHEPPPGHHYPGAKRSPTLFCVPSNTYKVWKRTLQTLEDVLKPSIYLSETDNCPHQNKRRADRGWRPVNRQEVNVIYTDSQGFAATCSRAAGDMAATCLSFVSSYKTALHMICQRAVRGGRYTRTRGRTHRKCWREVDGWSNGLGRTGRMKREALRRSWCETE